LPIRERFNRVKEVMHAHHQVFLDALATKRRLSVRFFNKRLGRELERICAPLDYGPLRGAAEPTDHYHLWDLEGKRKPLNVALVEGDVVSMTLLPETFAPAEIITWAFKSNAWHIPRDWAEFS
jgi:hypothetical protein